MFTLKQEIDKICTECKVGVSIFVNFFGNNRSMLCYRSATVLESGSSINIPIMLTVLQKVQDGSLHLEQQYIIPSDRLPSDRLRSQNIDDNGAHSTTNIVDSNKDVYTLHQIISWMIINDDNRAANLLIDLVGFDSINNYCKKIELQATVLNEKLYDVIAGEKGKHNYTSAVDMFIIFEGLCENKMLSPKLCRYALNLLNAQNNKQYVSSYSYHERTIDTIALKKDARNHQVGISYLKGKPYFLGILVEGEKELCDFSYFIAKIEQLIWDYYS